MGDLFSSTYPEEAKAAAIRTWRNADIRVLVVQTGFTQLREFSELLEGADRCELNHLSLFCNLSSDEMVSMIEVGVHDTSPSMGVFRMPEVGDPLALDEIPSFVKKWFVHATGGDELKETRQIPVVKDTEKTDEPAECADEDAPQKPGFFAKLLGKGARK